MIYFRNGRDSTAIHISLKTQQHVLSPSHVNPLIPVVSGNLPAYVDVDLRVCVNLQTQNAFFYSDRSGEDTSAIFTARQVSRGQWLPGSVGDASERHLHEKFRTGMCE